MNIYKTGRYKFINHWGRNSCKSTRPEMFCKKAALKNFVILTRKHQCWSLLFNKAADLRTPILKNICFFGKIMLGLRISSEERCVKSVRIRSYSGRYFPAFGLNTDQSECGKIRTRITPNTDTFYAVEV